MARMPNVADVLVVGLGAVGSAALYQSAKLGARVIGIDRFDPPHDQGSSHGDTRITREAIGEGREFVPLVLRSNQIWQELETTTGRNLLTRNGGLVLASPSMPGNHHGSTSFIKDTIAAATEFSIAHEILSTDELCHRYPQFRLRGDEIGYFEPGAGFLRPEACIDAQLTLGKHLGAKVDHLGNCHRLQTKARWHRRGHNQRRYIFRSEGHRDRRAVDSEVARRGLREVPQDLSAGNVLVRGRQAMPSSTPQNAFPCSSGSRVTGRAT